MGKKINTLQISSLISDIYPFVKIDEISRSKINNCSSKLILNVKKKLRNSMATQVTCVWHVISIKKVESLMSFP